MAEGVREVTYPAIGDAEPGERTRSLQKRLALLSFKE